MPTLLYGNQALPAADLKADKKAAKKIGPVGMGKRALYLNSFYISRMYYVMWTDIRRVYKLVAMSKGGFTGIGAFGSMSYLVVELRDGRTKKCQIKYETMTDQALVWIAEHHPEIPTRSALSQRKLDEKLRAERSRPKTAPDAAAEQWAMCLTAAKQYLEEKPALYAGLSAKAGKKRVQQMVPAGKRILGVSIFAAAIGLIAAGIPFAVRQHPAGIYLLLFGVAFLFYSLMGNLLPAGRNAPKRIEAEWQEAVRAMEEYIGLWEGYGTEQNGSFPVPARYAHPVVLERMIRAIREGRAKNPDEALEVVKEDLKKLNRTVRVSQEEYDEVVAVKPMFLISDYK